MPGEWIIEIYFISLSFILVLFCYKLVLPQLGISRICWKIKQDNLSRLSCLLAVAKLKRALIN